MQFEDFVAESLRQIVAGVKRAQESTQEAGANINPRLGNLDRDRERVEFDVAVTAAEEKGTKGGIGVFVGPVGLGSQGESNATNTTASRIKFSVIVVLPQGQKF